MAEPSVFQGVYIAPEVTPGTFVAPTKRLPSISIEPMTESETEQYGAVGNKFDTISILNKEWSTAKFGGKLTFDEIIYPFAWTFGAPVSSTPVAGVQQHIFRMANSAPDTLKSFSIKRGANSLFNDMAYALGSEIGLKFSRNGLELEGNMIGQALVQNTTAPGVTADVPQIPITPAMVDIRMADSYAGLTGASPLDRGFSFEWTLSDRLNPVWPLRSSFGSFASVVETKPKVAGKLVIGADAVGRGLYTNFRANTKKYVRLTATGALITGVHNYTLQIDTAFYVAKVDELKDNDGVFAYTYSFAGAKDTALSGESAFEILVKNTTATL